MKEIYKYHFFLESINQNPISNFESYIDGISKSIVDKLFFLNKIELDCLVDFGCANGKILSEPQITQRALGNMLSFLCIYYILPLSETIKAERFKK